MSHPDQGPDKWADDDDWLIVTKQNCIHLLKPDENIYLYSYYLALEKYAGYREVRRGEDQKYSIAIDVWSLGVVLFYLTTGGEYPSLLFWAQYEIEDWHQHQQAINYEDLWKFSNSFFEMDDGIVRGIQDVINQMIVVEKSMRISIELARRNIQQIGYRATHVHGDIDESAEAMAASLQDMQGTMENWRNWRPTWEFRNS